MKKNLRAFTLIETLVAMTIILIVAGVISLVFVNFVGSGRISLKIKAHILISNIKNHTRNNILVNKTYQVEDIQIEESYRQFEYNPKLTIMEFKAKSNDGFILDSYCELIELPE